MIQVVFKICYTERSIRYEVPGHWTTEYFFHKIRDYLSEDFDIPNTYHIVPGPGFQIPQYQGFPEEYPPVEVELRSDQSLIEYCNPNEVNAFYIRFLDEPELPDDNEIRRVIMNPITS
jgi:hypothetical protein